MRQEFSMRVRKAAWERANGTCECGCDQPFGNHPKERPEYDHRVPAYLGGDNSLENCLCIRVDCHRAKTATEDTPRIVKARRGEKLRRGLTGPKRKIPGSKGTPFKKRVDGGVEPR